MNNENETTKNAGSEEECKRPDPKPGELYKHFKKHIVQIINLALHTENETEMVVYKRIDNGSNDVFARPLDMFMSKVDTEKYPDVKQVYRFEKIYDAPTWLIIDWDAFAETERAVPHIMNPETLRPCYPAKLSVKISTGIDGRGYIRITTELTGDRPIYDSMYAQKDVHFFERTYNVWMYDACNIWEMIKMLVVKGYRDKLSAYGINQILPRLSALLTHVFGRPIEVCMPGCTDLSSHIDEENLYLLVYSTKEYPEMITVPLVSGITKECFSEIESRFYKLFKTWREAVILDGDKQYLDGEYLIDKKR